MHYMAGTMRDAFRATFIAATNTASKSGSPKPELTHLADFNASFRAALRNATPDEGTSLATPIFATT
jgi:hypothetical protein